LLGQDFSCDARAESTSHAKALAEPGCPAMPACAGANNVYTKMLLLRLSVSGRRQTIRTAVASFTHTCAAVLEVSRIASRFESAATRAVATEKADKNQGSMNARLIYPRWVQATTRVTLLTLPLMFFRLALPAPCHATGLEAGEHAILAHTDSTRQALMMVSELSRRGGLTPHTVRFYVRKGLLSPKRQAHNGYQVFGRDDLERVDDVERELRDCETKRERMLAALTQWERSDDRGSAPRAFLEELAGLAGANGA
jgi:hypothetical protein